MWIDSARIIIINDGNAERNDETGNHSLKQFAVAKWKKQEVMQDLSLQTAQSIKPRNLISAKHRRLIPHDVQMDGEKRRRLPKVHARTQPHARNHGSLGPRREWAPENPQIDARSRGRRSWKLVVHCSDHSRRIQHDTNASTS